MSKKHHGGPVPPGNRPKSRTSHPADEEGEKTENLRKGGEISAQQEDPKHRMGDFTGKADHSIQEPDGKNGADH